MATPESSTVTLDTTQGPVAVAVVTQGEIGDGARDYAVERVGGLIGQIREPVLFARVKLTHAPDPARDRPAIAQVAVDVNGDLLRAQVSAPTMPEAIDLLKDRLRARLEHRAEHREARRHRPANRQPGEWRHGDPPTARPEFLVRPAEERELVRHKSYSVDELTPDEAAFDLEQLGFEFHLFRELATGDDALIERGDAGSYRLTRRRPAATETAPTAVTLTAIEHPAPELTVDAAIELLLAEGDRHLFFSDTTTGRGNVVYLRYDGHYGLITPV